MKESVSIISQDVRSEIDELISAGDLWEARRLLGELWRRASGPATANFVISRFERLRGQLESVTCRLALLRSFALEPLVPMLRAAAATKGVDLEVQLGGFNGYAQELLDPAGALYRFAPDLVFLAVQTRDVAPELWTRFADLTSHGAKETVDRVRNSFRGWVEAFRSQSQAHLVVHTLEIPAIPRNGILDPQSESGQAEAIRTINREVLHLAQEHPGVYLLDYDALVARYGRLRWHDEGKWLTMRMPIAADCLPHLANEYLRFLCALTGKRCKVLVTDLDNTLWGGVVGEDAFTGLQMGPDYPGAAYQAVQRALLDLHRRGLILAICSKNNLVEATEVLERHPQMLLRPQHFAALRINWNDKVANLREIAAELNVGTDSLAFLDDDPGERAWVRGQMPEVTVIELATNPMEYAQALRDTPELEQLKLSSEDRQRGRYYAEQSLRESLRKKAGSLEEFYSSLRIWAEVSLVAPVTLARVAQLTQKTNQFNLTTQRYSEQEIAEMAADPAWRVYCMKVTDRFGDNGIVGVAITRFLQHTCEIDSFLLSCRVLGRGLETALLAVLARDARSSGAQKLVGCFRPTKRNAPARGLYASHGFACIREHPDSSCWQFDLTGGMIRCPPWIELDFKEEERNERIPSESSAADCR